MLRRAVGTVCLGSVARLRGLGLMEVGASSQGAILGYFPTPASAGLSPTEGTADDGHNLNRGSRITHPVWRRRHIRAPRGA